MDSQITELQVHFWLVLVMFAFAVQTFVLLLLVNAPYGRFTRKGWGPTISTRSAWVLFESPAVVVFAAVYLTGDHALETVPLVLFGIWQFHYVIRTFVFPFRIRETGKRIPMIIVILAILFNLLNAYINARWISHLGDYPVEWLTTTPFIAGVSIFVVGWIINQHADLTLFRLRKPGDTNYAIPRGGLYEQVSCPNYLGEILEWIRLGDRYLVTRGRGFCGIHRSEPATACVGDTPLVPGRISGLPRVAARRNSVPRLSYSSRRQTSTASPRFPASTMIPPILQAPSPSKSSQFGRSSRRP